MIATHYSGNARWKCIHNKWCTRQTSAVSERGSRWDPRKNRWHRTGGLLGAYGTTTAVQVWLSILLLRPVGPLRRFFQPVLVGLYPAPQLVLGPALGHHTVFLLEDARHLLQIFRIGLHGYATVRVATGTSFVWPSCSSRPFSFSAAVRSRFRHSSRFRPFQCIHFAVQQAAHRILNSASLFCTFSHWLSFDRFLQTLEVPAQQFVHASLKLSELYFKIILLVSTILCRL